MGFIEFIVNFLKDPRTQIAAWIATLGPVLVYCPLFLVVFIETGVVFFPFLPGDSLLFACGVFSAEGWGLNLVATLLVFYAAAILGNTSNYWIARFFGSRIIDSGKVKALTPERMAKLDYFFEKYGGLTIVITRFMPFFRTFAPFIAGTGHMNFAKFTLYNAIGGISWVSLFVLVGYFFGGVPFVQQHFSAIVLGIIFISVLPAIIGAIRGAPNSRKYARLWRRWPGQPVPACRLRLRRRSLRAAALQRHRVGRHLHLGAARHHRRHPRRPEFPQVCAPLAARFAMRKAV